jgi:hypothetical protein
MSDLLEQVLSVSSAEQYSEFVGVEQLFHDALGEGRLSQLLERFPRSVAVKDVIESQVLTFEALQAGWQDELLAEIRSLISLLPPGRVKAPIDIQAGPVSYDTDDMFTLRAEMGRALRRHTVADLSPHERAFLNDFYFGVDFTHWTKWALLLDYTELELRLPTILRARRNDVDFCIDAGRVLYTAPES